MNLKQLNILLADDDIDDCAFFKKAIEDFNKVLLINPDNVQALFNRAKLKKTNKDLKGAIKDYDKIIKLYPYFLEAYYNRAEIKFLLHDVAGSKKDMETGQMMSDVYHAKSNSQLSRDSTLIVGLFRLSADFENTPKTSIDTLNIQFQSYFYISENSELLNGHSINSHLLNKINKQENKSFVFTNNEITSDGIFFNHPKSTAIDWTEVIRKTNSYFINDAKEYINTLISDDTLNPLAFFQRAILTCREIESLNNLNIRSKSGKSSFDADANKVNEMWASAMNDYTKAIQLEPTFYFAYFNRGNIKCMLSDFEGALKDYETGAELKPDFAEAHFNSGYVMYYLNDRKTACNEFSKAGELGITSSYSFIKKYCTTITK